MHGYKLLDTAKWSTCSFIVVVDSSTLWARSNKNPDVSIGPLARPFALSHALLTHLLAPHCLLPSHAPLCSFVRSLAHSLTHFRVCGKVNDSMSQNDLVLSHSGLSKNLVKSFFHFSCQPILHLSVFIKNFRRYLAGYVLPLSTSG